jgi:hypothetical protein
VTLGPEPTVRAETNKRQKLPERLREPLQVFINQLEYFYRSEYMHSEFSERNYEQCLMMNYVKAREHILPSQRLEEAH